MLPGLVPEDGLESAPAGTKHVTRGQHRAHRHAPLARPQLAQRREPPPVLVAPGAAGRGGLPPAAGPSGSAPPPAAAARGCRCPRWAGPAAPVAAPRRWGGPPPPRASPEPHASTGAPCVPSSPVARAASPVPVPCGGEPERPPCDRLPRTRRSQSIRAVAAVLARALAEAATCPATAGVPIRPVSPDGSDTCAGRVAADAGWLRRPYRRRCLPRPSRRRWLGRPCRRRWLARPRRRSWLRRSGAAPRRLRRRRDVRASLVLPARTRLTAGRRLRLTPLRRGSRPGATASRTRAASARNASCGDSGPPRSSARATRSSSCTSAPERAARAPSSAVRTSPSSPFTVGRRAKSLCARKRTGATSGWR